MKKFLGSFALALLLAASPALAAGEAADSGQEPVAPAGDQGDGANAGANTAIDAATGPETSQIKSVE